MKAGDLQGGHTAKSRGERAGPLPFLHTASMLLKAWSILSVKAHFLYRSNTFVIPYPEVSSPVESGKASAAQVEEAYAVETGRHRCLLQSSAAAGYDQSNDDRHRS